MITNPIARQEPDGITTCSRCAADIPTVAQAQRTQPPTEGTVLGWCYLCGQPCLLPYPRLNAPSCGKCLRQLPTNEEIGDEHIDLEECRNCGAYCFAKRLDP